MLELHRRFALLHKKFGLIDRKLEDLHRTFGVLEDLVAI